MVEQLLATPCVYVPRQKSDFRPFVYGLVDPVEPAHVRYVGMAIVHGQRPYQHAERARKPYTKATWPINWIRTLQSEGREPAVLVLEELSAFASRHLVGEIEKYYINSLRSIGHRLTNMADGGWGGQPKGAGKGRKASEEAKRHISIGVRESHARPEVKKKLRDGKLGHSVSAETRALLSAKSKGHTRNIGAKHPHSEATKALLSALNKGKPGHACTPATRKKIGDANRGRVRSAEAREHSRLAHLGKIHPPEFGEAISARMQGHAVSRDTREKLALTTAAMHATAVPGHAGMLGKAHSVETRAKMGKVWSDPERRAAHSALMKAFWARRKAEVANGQ